MGFAYGQDLRDRVLAAYDRGMRTKQIADLFTGESVVGTSGEAASA